MQLIEFFLWRNLNDKELNKLFSFLGALLLMLQPVASLMLLKDITLRNKLLTIYGIPAFSYFIYEIANKNFLTSISKNGHLKWDWVDLKGNKQILFMCWLFFLFFSIFYNKHYLGLAYTVALLIITLYSYKKDGSFGSLWCWSINSLMIFYAIKLLVVIPYKEHGLC
jgi:general stress protein CsbA